MPDLTNILPPADARKVRLDYFLRLGTTAAFALSALVLIHAALLVPSYVYLSEEVRLRETELSELSALLATTEAGTVDGRLRVLSEEADALIALAGQPSSSAALAEVLALPRSGVRIIGMAVTAPEGGEPRMSVSGVAATRDALRRFHGELSKLPGISRADLPLSVYAAETDLAFTVQLSGLPTP